MNWKQKLTLFVMNLITALIIYTFIALAVYAWRHPERTDRQIILEIGKALTWQ